MGGVAEESYAAEAPTRQRILVDHWKFEDLVGVANESGHVEPSEMPIGEGGAEILEPAAPIPVAPLVPRRLDLGHPVDELGSRAVDVVADRVDHHFAGGEPTGAHHAGSREKGRPARHAAPHVDAGIAWRPFIRI